MEAIEELYLKEIEQTVNADMINKLKNTENNLKQEIQKEKLLMGSQSSQVIQGSADRLLQL